MEFHSERENLQHQVDSLALTFEPAASEALWNYDDDQLNAALAGLYRNEEIVGAEILTTGERYYTTGIIENQPTKRPVPGADNELLKQGSDEEIYDILYKSEYPLASPDDPQELLGTMVLYSSLKTVIERTYFSFIITIVLAIVKTLCLWLIAVIIISKLVGRPISELKDNVLGFNIESARQIHYKNPDPETLSKNNELYFLEQSMAALYTELENKNYLVNQYTKNLEAVIEERTRELNESLKKMIHYNQVKSDFLATMSHELRTPLNSIIGFTRRLTKNDRSISEEKSKEILGIILNSSEHLLSLINNILDMAKIEAGKMEVGRTHLKIEEILTQVIGGLAPQAEEKGISLHADADAGAVEIIYADPVRLRQILINLINNAIKFTEQGSVTIEWAKCEHSGHPGVEISVADTGIGIAPEDLPKLFNQFEQLGNSPINTVPGTGLGLALVNQLVNLHGGEISVESELGKGSRFVVWFPDEDQGEIGTKFNSLNRDLLLRCDDAKRSSI